MAISAATFIGDPVGPEIENRRRIEYISVTGSTAAAGETTTYTPRHVRDLDFVESGVISGAQSTPGGTITLTCRVAFSDGVIRVKLVGKPGV